MDLQKRRPANRREFLKASLGGATAAIVLAACGAPPPPTAAPKPTEPPRPQPATAPTQAPAATQPPAATSAPAVAATSAPAAAAPTAAAPTSAAKPTEAAKPKVEGVMRPPEPNPKRGGTLRGAWGITTSNFDVHQGGSSNVLTHLYNNLVVLNLGDGIRSIAPDLAVRWTISPDGKAYTFQLREGVKYHDGTPFTSADALASFQRIIFPPTGVISVNKDIFSFVDKIEAPDEKTIKFTLKEPRVYFLELLADPAHVIYSKKHLDANNNDLKKVIVPGTGPFVFKENKQAEKWTFTRNPNYWDPELPYVDQLELIHAAAWTDRGTAVLTNQADWTWNTSIETWNEGQKRTAEIGTNRLYNYGAYAFLFNTRKKPFDDPRVRRAIHLAVSRQDLIKAFQTQEWINVTRWTPHGDKYALSSDEIAKLPGYRADKTADIAEAKKLLADAGYADGIKGVDLLSASVAAHAEIMAPAFQEQVKRTLGIEMKIRVQERALLVNDEQQGNYQVVLDTPGHLLSDIAPLASAYFKTGGSRNYMGFSDAEFDKTLAAADSETDETKRAALVRKLEDMLDAAPPWYLVGYTFHLIMWRKTMKGMAFDLRQRSQWGRVDTAWLDK